jgi:hypothetical protein
MWLRGVGRELVKEVECLNRVEEMNRGGESRWRC